MRYLPIIFLFWVMLTVLVCRAQSQSKAAPECPRFDLLRSLDAVVVGDKVMFNVVTTGGNLRRSALRYTWRVFPKGKIVISRDTTVAILDTSTVRENWVVISADFANWRQCNWHESREIRIRRKGPYTKTDEFWWWFHLNENHLRAFNDPDHKEWIEKLEWVLRFVDDRLTFRIDTDREDPIKQGFIVGYRGKPYNAKLVADFVARAPSLAGWEILIDKSAP
jgi:hypothetical protein